MQRLEAGPTEILSPVESEEELARRLDGSQAPQHIAIIMDGNRRWAREHGLAVLLGHRAGARATRATIEGCSERGVKALTLYAFSTENWRRPALEVRGLLRMIEVYIKSEREELHRNRVRVRHLGELEGLPAGLAHELRNAIAYTKDNDGLTLNLAINYGSRGEILHAARQIGRDLRDGTISDEDISEDLLSSYLATSELPDPDLLIRTAGEMRLSNFLLWQLAYTEIYVTPVHWPDFDKRELYTAMMNYQQRERRFGGV